MLKDYPMIFDNVTIPFYPSGYSRTDDKLETVNQTEDGHDDVEIKRTEKTSISLSFNVNDRWAAIFQEFRRKPQISVQLYDKVTRDYETKIMRIEDYSESLEPNSDRIDESMGLYSISFTLEEF